MLNLEVPCVWYLIRRIVKTYDYINRIVLTLPLSVYEGTWTHSPLSLLCITMILRVHRKILKLLRSPTVASEPGFMRRCYIHLTESTVHPLPPKPSSTAPDPLRGRHIRLHRPCFTDAAASSGYFDLYFFGFSLYHATVHLPQMSFLVCRQAPQP